MQTKLTLRMDGELIRKAKDYSEKTGKSLSQMVADYFDRLTVEKEERYEPSTPITRSLRGALRGAMVNEDDYRRHLEEKHE